MSKPEMTASRERVLDVAEKLFSEQGYASVTLRDIAAQLQMKVSSLYYHAPQGKEALFVAVVERMMQRHQQALNRVIADQGNDWQAQLYGVAHWLLSQPPLDTSRIMRSDLRELSKEHADHMMWSMYLVMQPIEQVFAAARIQTGKPMPHPGILAGTFLTIINGFHLAPLPMGNGLSKVEAADQIIAVFIKGLLAD